MFRVFVLFDLIGGICSVVSASHFPNLRRRLVAALCQNHFDVL
ncbi:hypothetical protein MtrunA17_Chr7g0221261 [Medicago truncatula]|uniref:Uncharacterized protein n=1 Tax=Medicago truncatula TaxID=3880 RepID=A0A396GTY2_MEDTR|nr:hypothetical protein MtrunA17_Chr7g0221261 [Medicago truncatula]